MKILCMDTAHKHLIITLLEGNRLVSYHEELAWKKQSEQILPMIEQLFMQANWKPNEVEQIVITKGPGSYTGVRIAMTIAKILASRLQIPIYTLSTLQYYAGLDYSYVVLDARGKRVYCALYKAGKAVMEDQIMSIEEFLENRDNSIPIIGDGEILGFTNSYPNLKTAFLDLKDQWKKEKEAHLLTPEYLKQKDAYKP